MTKVISGPTFEEGCLVLTLSKRAPVPRAARASISHSRSDLRNQRDAEQSGRSRSPDLSFLPPVFSLRRMYFRPSFSFSLFLSPPPFHTQPISVTWRKSASSCSLGTADLESAEGWSSFLFSLIKPKIPDMVSKMKAICHVQVAPYHQPLSCLSPLETQFTLLSV